MAEATLFVSATKSEDEAKVTYVDRKELDRFFATPRRFFYAGGGWDNSVKAATQAPGRTG